MKKKGFTLIELLAVIILLAVIALIATPIVLNVVDNAKQKANEASMQGYGEALKLAVYDYQFANNGSIPDVNQEWVNQNVKKSGNEIVCKEYYYSQEYGPVLHECTVDGSDELFYLANQKVYKDPTDPEYRDIYQKVSGKKLAKNCTFDGTLKAGTEFVDGQYTYKYMRERTSSENGWQSISTDGWGVALTDRDSTDPVTTDLCTTINDKPIVSMNHMFFNSKAISIDLSSFNTSNVTDMGSMFSQSKAVMLDLSSFDTSKVTNMNGMFSSSQATSLDLSNFGTSNVTNMGSMFSQSEATNIDISSFDTRNVTNMSGMFSHSEATSLDLSNFDTSNVTNMNSMFYGSQATSLDLSNFDTSNVTNMGGMFSHSEATSLDLSNFDTSNVTNMCSMFSSSQATSLDLSNFDTSNVTNMGEMFYNSQATSLDLSNFDTHKVSEMTHNYYGILTGMFQYSQAKEIKFGDGFDTSNVTNMAHMFWFSQATSLDLSSFDTSNVTDMSYMFWGSRTTTGYARTQEDADRLNASSYKPDVLTFIVKE